MFYRFKYHLLFSLLILGSWAKAQNADIDLLRKFHTPGKQKGDDFFHLLSETTTPLTVGLGAASIKFDLLRAKTPCERLQTLKPITTIGIPMLVTWGLKHWIKRDRPFVTYPDIIPKERVEPESFPSGHTTAAFATATALTMRYPKWYVAVPAYGRAVLVAYSRMRLGVHYPSDVLAGALIGTCVSYVCYKLTDRFIARTKPCRTPQIR